VLDAGVANRTAIVRRLTPLLLLVLLIVGSTASARAQVVDAEDGFAARISQERAAAGLPALAPAADLQAVARRHAQRMADRGTPFHNPDLESEVTGWSLLGENVGYGPDVDTVHGKFMESPDHRRIILMPELTQVGVGVVRTGDGRLWVVEVFRRPEAAPAPAPAPPASSTAATPTTAPPTTVAPPAPTPTTAMPLPAPTVPPPAPVTPAEEQREVSRSARPAAVLGVIAVRPTPAPAVPALDVPSDAVPAVAWAAGLLLAAVVALQAQTVRRLGLLSQ
jgi:hypothetical protein